MQKELDQYLDRSWMFLLGELIFFVPGALDKYKDVKFPEGDILAAWLRRLIMRCQKTVTDLRIRCIARTADNG